MVDRCGQLLQMLYSEDQARGGYTTCRYQRSRCRFQKLAAQSSPASQGLCGRLVTTGWPVLLCTSSLSLGTPIHKCTHMPRNPRDRAVRFRELRGRGAGLRVLNLGGGDVDTSSPMGWMLFPVMAALAQMGHEIRRERINDSISTRREAGEDLGGRPRRITDSQIRTALRWVRDGELAAQVPATWACRGHLYRRSRALRSPMAGKM